MMIRELFFPRKVRGKLLFSEKRVGIAVEDLSIHVAHISASRNKNKIARLETYQVNEGEEKTYHQRLGTSLRKVAETIPKKAYVRANFPSSKVVIKELTVPFLDEEKIRMVVEYEVEASIPFTLDKAVIDFIIIDQSEVKQSSTILVAAAQVDDVKKYVETFSKAGITIHALTVDAFDLADLFGQTPPYSELKQDSALVDIGEHSTRVVLLRKNMLSAIRTVPKGLGGLSEKATAKARKKHVSDLLDEISFTINSFEMKSEKKLQLKKVYYLGPSDFFEEFESFCTGSLQVVCEKFATEGVLSADRVHSTVSVPSDDWNTYAHALGTALASKQFSHFTLRQKEASLPAKPAVQRHLIVATLLFLTLFGSLGIQGYLETTRLAARIRTTEAKAIRKLRGMLPKDNRARKRSKLNTLLKATDEYVQEQEEVWAPFSKQRLRPNEVLLELGMLFNHKKFDLTIDEINISGEEHEAHPIVVVGMFRSKGGGSDHFAQFGTLEQDIKDSTSLTLTEEIDPSLEEDGIRFVVRLKPAEE